jgi:hydroxymethylpyrimidine pyrophosphatase-like HAD family hydrolase
VAYRMLAFDYDETLATGGEMQPATAAALAAARKAGWQLALVTGRPHQEMLGICPYVSLFDLIVDENGGVLYLAATGQAEELAARPDPRLRQELDRRAIPYVHGPIVTITRRPHEQEVAAILRELSLAMDTYCNRHAIMIVPRGTCKATGLRTGLARLGLAAGEVIAVGDDQNDVDFLRMAGLGVAVANAIDEVKAAADMVTAQPNGAGVAQFIYEQVLAAPEKLPAARNVP